MFAFLFPFCTQKEKEHRLVPTARGKFGGWVDGWLAGIMSRIADTDHKRHFCGAGPMF